MIHSRAHPGSNLKLSFESRFSILIFALVAGIAVATAGTSTLSLAADAPNSGKNKGAAAAKPNQVEQTAPSNDDVTIGTLQAPDASAGSEGKLSPGAGSQMGVGIQFNIGGKPKKDPEPDPIPAPKGKKKLEADED